MDDYEELNQALVTVANTVNRSMAEISVQVSQPEGQDQALVDEDSVAGVIFEDNGVELLVAAKSLAVPEGGSLQARLVDGNSYSVSVKRQDTNLGIAVYAIAKNTLSENAWNQIQTVALGSSGSVSKGDPVIAIGSPFGYYGGMGIGVVSSTRETVSRADGDYSLLCTDIGGSTSGTGILLNTDGQIIGLIDQERFYGDGESGPVAAYGISDLKDALEFLSNGQAVPYIGIQGVTVTEELTDSQGIPAGVYVQEVSADSPAMAAGIQSGDVIAEVDGTSVTTLSGYNNALMQQETGNEIRIRGQRQGTGGYVDITFRVTVGSKE
ncbi:S1C family serine protease [Eubacterium sp. ER2]|uniref:S1C family serine protease n=1 Tax=Eubacterium sp. ER2 TaxID=1519438 RepID=UPI00068FA932|nr:S1C family serine protease [Eubacterium sp. ER2]